MIHQVRLKCQVEKTQTHRLGVSPSETQAEQGWEAYHSTKSLQAEVMETCTAFRKIK